MTVSLRELLEVSTPEQARTRILQRLADAKFPVTDWTPGGAGRTFAEMAARESAMFSLGLVSVAGSGYLSTARWDWLTLLALETYGLQRYPAVHTEGVVLLTCDPGEGPYNIQPGQLWFSDGAKRFINTDGGALQSGETLAVTVRAESPGAVYNVPVNTITMMLTPLVGVTATNAPIGATETWITTQGADEESDSLLQQRCRSRWATLGLGANSDWYIYHARNGHPFADQVTRVLVWTDPSWHNKVTLFLGGPDGKVESRVIDAVFSSIRAKMPLTTELEVLSVTNRNIDLEGTIFARRDDTGVRARALEELAKYIETLGIGDTVFHSQMVDAMQFDLAVVRNVVLTDPSGDIDLGFSEVAHIADVDGLVVEVVP